MPDIASRMVLVTITIRPQRPDDESAARRVLTAAFRDDGQVAALAEALRGRLDRGAALVAVDGSSGIIGHVQLSVSWVDARDRLVEVLVLSPLAVAPTHQSRGIGTRLLIAARTKAESVGAPLLFLEGDPGYYSARGWRPAGELGFFPPSTRIPAAGFQVVTLRGYDPTTMRGRLIYNDTFWSHDRVGLRGSRLDRSAPSADAAPTHPA
jgi:putative acetyltransferase